jgi:hypothetical protein
MSRVDAKYLKLLRTRYRTASKKEKGVILDEFVKATSYDRKYAIALLNGKRDYVQHVVRRPRSTQYGAGLIPHLLFFRDLFNGIVPSCCEQQWMSSYLGSTKLVTCRLAENPTRSLCKSVQPQWIVSSLVREPRRESLVVSPSLARGSNIRFHSAPGLIGVKTALGSAKWIWSTIAAEPSFVGLIMPGPCALLMSKLAGLSV